MAFLCGESKFITMKNIQITNVSPDELVDLIKEGIKNQLQELSAKTQTKDIPDDKPHFTRKEVATFFNVSVGCINDWSNKGILKPFKVGQRTYFSKEECIKVLFNKE